MRIILAIGITTALQFLLLSNTDDAYSYQAGAEQYFKDLSTSDAVTPIKPSIHLEGNTRQINNMTRWLSGIVATEKGRETINAITHSGHHLMIRHEPFARTSAGRTIAPLTNNLINGKGESIEIIFDADIPDYGSHLVFTKSHELIEFNALQNLYHELAHAMHQMQGTWRYFDSEGQAIEEENIFRRQLALLENGDMSQRYGKDGEVIDANTIMYTSR